MVFGRKSALRCALGIASGLGDGVAKGDSLKSRDFLIISRRDNILPLCLAWIAAMVVATADVTAFVIDC